MCGIVGILGTKPVAADIVDVVVRQRAIADLAQFGGERLEAVQFEAALLRDGLDHICCRLTQPSCAAQDDVTDRARYVDGARSGEDQMVEHTAGVFRLLPLNSDTFTKN